MSTSQSQSAGSTPVAPPSPWATGLALFAGVMMVVAGLYQVFAGLAAILHDVVYLATPAYIYSMDLTGWGWIHLVLGILLLVVGAGVVSGQKWARFVGIGLVALSMIANFLFVPYYPVWSLLIIALEVAVIWALAVYEPA
jgi:hypothetical protein